LAHRVISWRRSNSVAPRAKQTFSEPHNAAIESFFSSLKTERTGRKTYRTRDQARADVFDYIERFYNPKRRHSTIGYLSPMEFESQAGLA
jgi:putative transposase